MTVEEAKNKWCCMHEIEKCLADECMAWRWFDPAIKHNGYCGLAAVGGGGVMELYKWYKGTELPDMECDCVIIWNVRYDSPYDFRETIQKVESLGFIQTAENILGEYVLEFCDLTAGEAIPQEDVVAWMPIEFPRESEIQQNGIHGACWSEDRNYIPGIRIATWKEEGAE